MRRTTQITLVTAVVAVVLDLVTKWLAHLTNGNVPFVTPVINDELAFGVASFNVGLVPLVALFAAASVVIVHGWLLSRRSNRPAMFYGLLIGGVAGNLFDRIATGAVHDWLDLGVAIANLADFFLLAGLIWYATTAWKSVKD